MVKYGDVSPDDLGFPVSRVESRALRALETDLHRRGWSSSVTTGRELRVWAALATEVDSYSGEPEDYTNDLGSRDALALIVNACPLVLASRLGDRLRDIDDGFLRRTVPDDDHLLGRFSRLSPEQGWWWRRIPAEGPLGIALGVGEHPEIPRGHGLAP